MKKSKMILEGISDYIAETIEFGWPVFLGVAIAAFVIGVICAS